MYVDIARANTHSHSKELAGLFGSFKHEVFQMSIRRMLVPVVGRDCDHSTLKTAVQVAQKVGAHIDALFVRADAADFLPVMGEGYSGIVAQDILDAVDTAGDELAKKASDNVNAVAEAASLPIVKHGQSGPQPSISFHQAKGPLFAVLQQESQLTDLVVYTHPAQGLTSELANVLPDLLLGCRRPFLIAPDTPVPDIGSHIVIAWNSGHEAASAIRQARGFLPFAEKVEIAMIAEDEATAAAEIALPLAYLACHGVTAEPRIIIDKTRNAGDLILNEFERSGADLLVMGAYGHSRFREFIFGGATRQILQQANFPVFMAH
jgi:nucleotide-binding universal stress UspA family protein